MAHFAGHRHLLFQGQFNTLEHHVPVDPLEHHFTPVIHIAVAQQAERTESRKGEFAGQRFLFVVKIDQKRFFIARADEAGRMAVNGPVRFLAVDFPD